MEEEVIKPEVVCDISKDDKMLAMLAQILPIVVGFWPPLIIFLLKKEESEFIKKHAMESLNWQITNQLFMQ